MKVISGSLKGRVIKGFDISGTRPTMDRVKESIFGIIQNQVKDSIVLDLFAGAGTLGIEALSNYAKFVYFNDKNYECVKVIKENLETFKVSEKALVYNLDYQKCLNIFMNDKVKFDLVFLDPPYKFHVLNEILTYLAKNNLVNDKGLVIVEYEEENLKDKYQDLILKKKKTYGSKIVYIYERIESEK